MKKLTQQQIECIDDLLFMLGIKFVDIRYEMVDHIASELEAKEGDFKENLKGYFIMNKLDLLKQYKKTKRTSIIRAIKLYFNTMVTPLGLASVMMMFLGVYYSSFLVEDGDVTLLGGCMMLALMFPILWLGRKNRSISVMRPLALMPCILFYIKQTVTMASYSIDDRALRVIPVRISISVVAALMIVVIISLYRCRKQYVGKYI